MKLRFTKMEGAGNDFVMLDATAAPLDLSEEQVRRLADRRFGVGADQVLVVERTDQAGVDFRYRIYNGASGDEVEQCGNGARCFVHFDPRGLERAGPADPRDGFGLWKLDVGDQTVDVAVLSMGNPHAVQKVEDVDSAPVESLGPAIEADPHFPSGVNAGFMQVVARDRIRLRVFERGAGETLACGTGACAAVVAGIRLGLLDGRVDVEARGGRLTIEWAGGAAPVHMTGPATTVFQGEIEL